MDKSFKDYMKERGIWVRLRVWIRVQGLKLLLFFFKKKKRREQENANNTSNDHL
jgi:hypothetical protein